jgi:hypothetical protein
MKRIFVAYRENSLFREYMPSLVAGTEVAGTFILPRGADFKAERPKAVEMIRNTRLTRDIDVFVNDSTCAELISCCPKARFVSLNRIFGEQIGEYTKRQPIDKNVRWFAERIAQNRAIASIVVIDHCINNSPLEGKMTEIPIDRAAWYAKQIKEVFPLANVVRLPALKDAFGGCINDEHALIILDINCGAKEEISMADGWYQSLNNWKYKALPLILPLPIVTCQLVNRGKFNFDFNVDKLRSTFAGSVATH